VSFLIPIYSFAQKAEPREELKAGNKAYQQKNFDTAQNHYSKAVEKQPESFKSNFNLGDALYQKKDYANARKAFSNSAQLTSDKIEKAKALHNIGNTYMSEKKWEEAINVYKESLKVSAQNKNTMYNLAYAQEMLKKEKNNKDKNKDNKDNKDKDNKDNKDKDKNQDKKEQDKKEQDKGNQDREEGQQHPKAQPSKLSKQQAENLLNALQQEEKKLHEGEKDKGKASPTKLEKDW